MPSSGLDKLFEDVGFFLHTFWYSVEELDKRTETLTSEMSKTLTGMKTAWVMQDAFKSNLPLGEDKIRKVHTLTVDQWQQYFHLLIQMLDMKMVYHLDLIDKLVCQYYMITLAQLLTRYNMVVFGKSGAGKGVTIKTLIQVSSAYGNRKFGT